MSGEFGMADLTTFLSDEERDAVVFPQDIISTCHERADELRAENPDAADLLDTAAGAISTLMQSLTLAACLPDRLEADAAKFEEGYRQANNGQTLADLRARATSYYACAALIRQALK